jgi:hypothetical protein
MYQSKGEATFSAFPINPDIIVQKYDQKSGCLRKAISHKDLQSSLNRQFMERGFLIDHFKVMKSKVNEIS